MRIYTIAVAVSLAMWASIGNATILSAPCADDGDGVIVCLAAWDGENSQMNIVGDHDEWGLGHIGELPLTDRAAFFTNTPLDPTVTLHTTIDNDTGFAWTGYHINVYMNNYFTMSNAVVYTPLTSEAGWSGAVTVSPAVWNGSEWVGQVDYVGGTPIPNGGTLDFSYKMTFSGSTSYRYCQEMIPVPEPSALLLLSIGAMGLMAYVWNRRRS